MKLSAAQQKVLRTEVVNEYRIYSQNEHGRLYNPASQPTIKSLIARGLIFAIKDGIHPFATIIQLTNDGRKWGKSLLAEVGVGEMESELRSQRMELKRRTMESYTKSCITSRHGLADSDFEVRVSHDLRNLDKVIYNVRFDHMSINYDRDDGYYVKARGMDLQSESLAEYIRKLLICKEVIESGLLDD